MKRKHLLAFTLVELSIVLVIIGLVIGGVMAGRDLMQNAALRRFITQIENFDVAANTFQTKYNDLPGDIQPQRTAQFNLEGSGIDGSDGRGDGDGLLENGAVFADKGGIGGENTLFWVHLSQSGLIGYQFSTATGALAVNVPDEIAMRDYLPFDRTREVADYHAHGFNGRNYYHIAAITGAAAGTGTPVEQAGLTVLSAERIDEKLDDGLPFSGVVLARDNLSTPATPAAPAEGVCVENVNNLYNLAPDFRDIIGCSIRIRASF